MAKVLVLEDSPTQAQALCYLLQAEGFEVEAATDGARGLALHLEREFDIVVSDVLMPGMTGYEFCRAAKADPRRRDIPVVLLTSLSDPMDLVEGLACGADNFISKPYEPAHLIERLRAIIASRRARVAGQERAMVEVDFLGHRLRVSPDSEQILDLLLGAFQQIVRANRELDGQRQELAMRTEELARLNGDLSRARDLALRESQFKSRFLASMSHELRTPLNSIIGFSELLEQEFPGPLLPKQKDYVQNVLVSGRHLLTLVNEILDLTKIQAGKMRLAPEWTPLHPVVEAVLTSLRPVAEKQGVTLQRELPEELPELYVDPVRLKEILLNLGSNAVKFTPRGGQVTLSAGVGDDGLHISVADTGVGVSPANQRRLFREFEQIEAHGFQKPPGTGLGLALVKRLMELHGGTVAVESAEGKGSTFSVVFPNLRRGIGAPARGEPPAPPDAGPRSQVLVVEDDPGAAELIARQVRAAGLTVAVARSGEEAVQLAGRLQPQVITLDILMPGASGWTVLERLKCAPQTAGVPVVIVSVVDESERALSLGAAECLVKPVAPEALLAALTKLGLPLRRVAGARVLLVAGDDPDVHEIQALLRQAGCELRRAKALGALPAGELGELDVVLADVAAGEPEVAELRKLLERAPRLTGRVVALTGPDGAAGGSALAGLVALSRTEAVRGEPLISAVHARVPGRATG